MIQHEAGSCGMGVRRSPPFSGTRSQDVADLFVASYLDVPLSPWRRVRVATCATASPLAKRPYDLRHGAVSTWLSAGVPPAQVAEWAGHSVNVLLRLYGKCLAGQEVAACERVARVLPA